MATQLLLLAGRLVLVGFHQKSASKVRLAIALARSASKMQPLALLPQHQPEPQGLELLLLGGLQQALV